MDGETRDIREPRQPGGIFLSPSFLHDLKLLIRLHIFDLVEIETVWPVRPDPAQLWPLLSRTGHTEQNMLDTEHLGEVDMHKHTVFRVEVGQTRVFIDEVFLVQGPQDARQAGGIS